MFFLQPIWMLAAAGIIVPVLIHLWNVQQGKILKVGSIAFLTQSSKKYASSLKIREWLLLIIRCVLIIILAMLFAKPQWNQAFRPRKEKGWLLMENGQAAEAYNRFKPLVDSLIQAGYELHYFNAGFKKANLAEALRTGGNTPAKFLSYRLLVKQLDQLLPAELPVFLFTGNYLNRFTGSRPATSLNLHWNTYTPADSVSAFIQKAYAISADSIRIIVGDSRPSGATFSQEDISLSKNVNSGIQINHQAGKIFIRYLKNDPLPVDMDTLNITIFAGSHPADAKYLQAAIAAIQQFSKRIIRLQMPGNIENISSQQDWLFWLSELSVPQRIKAANIFTYQPGEVRKVHSWINTTASINGNEEQIALIKMISLSNKFPSSQPVWQNGFGDTILSLEKNHINTYRLFTHIDPSWNDLPWNDQFPQLIYSLLYPEIENGMAVENDKRTISSAQLLPANGVKDKTPLEAKFITKDVSVFFWLAAFIIFCIERFLAIRTRKELVYG